MQQLKFQHKGRRGEIVPIKCACDQPTPAEDVDLEALRAAKAQKTVQKKRVGNMDALDRTGQGIKESYARKVCPQAHQTACVYPSPPVPYTPCLLSLSASRRADASVKEIFSKILFGKPGTTPYEQLLTSDSEDEGSDGEGSGGAGADPVGLTGKQGGKVLACFLLSERDNPDFAKAFERGILPWLEKEQPKYKATRWASMGWARLRTRRRFATGAAGRSSAASDEYVVHLPDGRRLPRLTETYRLPRLPPEEGASVGGSECSRDRV